MPSATEDWSTEEDLQAYYRLLHLLELRTKDRDCVDAAKAMRALISEVDYLRHECIQTAALWARVRAGSHSHADLRVRVAVRVRLSRERSRQLGP